MPSVYAIGADAIAGLSSNASYDPSKGSGGVFAKYLSGVTPKYARNQGEREVYHKNTLARMFVEVTSGERRTFLASIGDSVLRNNIVGRLIGSTSSEATDTGYIDFFLQQIQCSINEKYQIVETLADNYVVYYFGQSAPIFQYSGELLNSVQDDQLSAWVRLYLHVLRGTQLARRHKTVSLKYDNFLISGTMFGTTWQHSAANELRIPFSFNFLVKKIKLINYTQGWKPTVPDDSFQQDPRLIISSGRARNPQGSSIRPARLTRDTDPETPLGEDENTPDNVLEHVENPPAWVNYSESVDPNAIPHANETIDELQNRAINLDETRGIPAGADDWVNNSPSSSPTAVRDANQFIDNFQNNATGQSLGAPINSVPVAPTNPSSPNSSNPNATNPNPNQGGERDEEEIRAIGEMIGQHPESFGIINNNTNSSIRPQDNTSNNGHTQIINGQDVWVYEGMQGVQVQTINGQTVLISDEEIHTSSTPPPRRGRSSRRLRSTRQ